MSLKGLKGKKVFITGASRGIGAATAKLFAAEGAEVVITYCEGHEEAHKTIEECRKAGATKAHLLHLDLRVDASIQNTVAAVVEPLGHVDILVNNAGFIVWKPLLEQSFEDIQHQLRVNLEGLIKFTCVMLPHVRETIINIASGAGLHAYPELAPYCATKFGVRGFTQALALEHPNLRIVAVNPGMTATRMTKFQGVAPEKVAEIIVKTAKRELGESGGDVNVREILEESS